MKDKDLRAYAPADLIRFMEHLHGAPAELEAYKDEDRNPPCRMVSASLAGGQIVFRVRSPKHKMTLDVSSEVLLRNPDLHKFLKEEQKGRWFVDALGLYPATDWRRRFTVSPRRAEALKTLLSGAVVPQCAPIEAVPDPDGLKLIESLTGKPLPATALPDWWCSSTIGPATSVSLGPSLGEIIYQAGELFASTHRGQVDSPLSQWIIDGGTTFAATSAGELVAKHPFFIRGGGWYSFRHIQPSEYKQVIGMIRELDDYRITHAAPKAIQ
ncbi:MAG: hypothetical protein ACRDDI_13515 [Aeromonas veronii]